MRARKPWYWAKKNAWYVQPKSGKQIHLGRHPTDAPPPARDKRGEWIVPDAIRQAYFKVMAGDPASLAKPDRLAVVQVCDLFLQHSQKHHAAGTFENYRRFLQSFNDQYPGLLAAEVKPFHVSKWLDANATWAGARRHAVLAVKRAFSWADKEGVFSPSPVRSVKADAVGRRTRVVTDRERQQVLAAIKDQAFRDFVVALQETGCRPGEVARVTAADVNFELGLWVLTAHKTAKKTRKPRVVYLTPAMLELTRTLAVKNPEGPLFRGPRLNRPFSRNAIRIRFRRLRAKHPELNGLVAYCYRHTFATTALVNGVGVAQVAELMGHTSTEMVSRVYGHLAQQVSHLRDAARQATGAA